MEVSSPNCFQSALKPVCEPTPRVAKIMIISLCVLVFGTAIACGLGKSIQDFKSSHVTGYVEFGIVGAFTAFFLWIIFRISCAPPPKTTYEPLPDA